MICMQDMRYDPVQHKEIGYFIVYLIYLLLVINVLTYIVVAVNDIQLRVRYCYLNRR